MREIRLAPRQQAFVQALLKGATYAQAYRKAKFPGHEKITDAVARGNGWSMAKTNPDIQLALKEAREELQERMQLEACDLVHMLLETRDVAMRADPPQASAAVGAIMGIAKILGIAIDRSEAHIIHHKPAPLPTTLVELSQADWQAQFDPAQKAIERAPQLDFLD